MPAYAGMTNYEFNMSETIKNISQLLIAKNWQLVTAESCTGGLVAKYLTDQAGSSQWFERGLITYSNAAKQELLGVSLRSLEKYGAVSEEVACEMALGALKHSRAQVSLAITGIAGPDGGSLDKPVGTVWFAFATKESEVISKMQHFPGDRQSIREQAALFALQGLLSLLHKLN